MINGKRICAVIPARMSSKRLPGKVLMNLAGKPVLERIIERVRAAKLLDDIIIATTENEADDPVIELCKKLNCNYYRGSEHDVLDRILRAAKEFKADVVCELTSDCPLIFWEHIDYLVDLHMKNYPEYDMTTNIETRSFPRGFDLRIVNIEALERSQKEIDNGPDLEHGLTWIYLNPRGKLGYKVQNWEAPSGQNRPDLEFTVDTEADLEFLSWLFGYETQGYNVIITCQMAIVLTDQEPSRYEKVAKIQRKDYFAELEQWYASMPKGGIVESNKAVLHKDSPISEKMSTMLKEAVKAIKPKGAKSGEPKKRGKKSGKRS